MERARAVEALPVWREDGAGIAAALALAATAEADASASSEASRLGELVALRPLAAQGSTACFVVASQESVDGANASRILLRISLLAGAGGDGNFDVNLTVEVPGYDVQRDGCFRQLEVGTGCRGLLLIARRCCAAVALPELGATEKSRPRKAEREVEAVAVPLVPPNDHSFVKVQWHPLSDAHVGVLLSDGSWQLLNLSHRATMSDPEVHFQVSFGAGGDATERVADFVFGAALPQRLQSGAWGAGEAAWLAMAVIFLSSTGRIAVRSPVLPSVAVLPRESVEGLAAAATTAGAQATGQSASAASDLEVHEWLRRTVLAAGACRDLPATATTPSTAGAFTSVRHGLHLHGSGEAYHRRWVPAQQLVSEERSTVAETSPRSPRSPRAGQCYCSLQVVAHSPVVVLARATALGVVDFVILDGALAPRFAGAGAKAAAASLTSSVFEEVDLVLPPAKVPPALCLSMTPAVEEFGAVLVARSRSLLAAIELPWLRALATGGGSAATSLPVAAVTTLSELREGPPSAGAGGEEYVGLQFVVEKGGLAAVLLKAQPGRGGAAATALAQSLDVASALRSAAKARATKPGAEGSATAVASEANQTGADREDYLRHLRAPVILPSPLFGADAVGSAEATAQAVAAVQSGQVAGLAARQHVLQHLFAQAPQRVAAVKAEVSQAQRAGSQLQKATAETKRRAERVRERQGELEQQFASVVEALAAELELRELDGVATQELPKLWSQLHELRQAFELLRAAAAGGSYASADAPSVSEGRLGTVEELQRTWTAATAAQLRSQATDLEAAVDAAVLRAKEKRGLVAA
eukprot:TRINITY_DN18642_c0_g1_i1.p2 TRINITY_DN18642_c0_g1~~TRINITY_DN18642_c0_g1_i1.p2  ORF type:complete len:813 (+),score=248.85 TRINITY_DN18642_c0_g1_i1:85-2523(+)